MTYTDQEKAAIIAQYQQGTSAQDLSKKYGQLLFLLISGRTWECML